MHVTEPQTRRNCCCSSSQSDNRLLPQLFGAKMWNSPLDGVFRCHWTAFSKLWACDTAAGALWRIYSELLDRSSARVRIKFIWNTKPEVDLPVAGGHEIANSGLMADIACAIAVSWEPQVLGLILGQRDEKQNLTWQACQTGNFPFKHKFLFQTRGILMFVIDRFLQKY